MRGYLYTSVENMVFTPYNKEEGYMPTISTFYGIRIVMYQTDKEHNPPHIHAIYGEHNASFLISNGELLKGTFPSRASRMVKEFILKYQNELLEMWNSSLFVELPGLE